MTRIPLTELVVAVVGDSKQAVSALKEFEAAKERAFASGDSAGLQRELDKLSATVSTVNRNLEPLARTSKNVTAEMRELGSAVKTGLVSVADGSKRFRELEASLKSQLGTLRKGTSEYRAVSAQMKEAGAEAKRLEGLIKSSNAAFKSDELGRYRQQLNEIVVAEKTGMVTRQAALSQLKSYQSGLAQQTGALEKNSAEHRAVVKVMGETGAAIRKLEAEGDRLEQAFRADYLKLYAGELRTIDASVRDIGFEKAAQEVEALTRDLKEQQGQLATNGREFNELGKLLQSAATQQERYQRAAEQAARANDAAQVRTYGSELKQLEAELQDTTAALGRLDAQQRAIRYDAAGVSAYRSQTEQLSGSFATIGRGLGELQGRLQDYARGLAEGSREHTDLIRVLQATEKATQSLTAQQERAAAAYRSADLSRFTTELRNIEQAQKAGLITTEQAARAVAQVEAEFKSYAAALGVTGRELGTFARAQETAGRGADQFAQAQERAARAFDAAALRQFTGELNEAVRAYREGETSTERYGRAVESVQGRLREYASTLDQSGREFSELNKLLELSERALIGVGEAAERSGKGFDPDPPRRYATELYGLDAAQRDLAASAEILERAQRSTQDAFAQTQLDRFRGELEAVSRAIKDGSGDFDVLARAVEANQRGMLDYLATLDKSSQEHADLSRAVDVAGSALKFLGTEAQRAGQGFDPQPVERFRTELEGLEGTGRELGQNFDQIQSELEQLDASLRDSGSSAQLSAREMQALGGVYKELEGASTRLAAANDKQQASFKSDALRQFRADLDQIVAAQKNGVITFEQAGRAVDALQGRMREYSQSTSLTVREQGELARVMGLTESAVLKLSQAQERAGAAFVSGEMTRYRTELLELQRALEAGVIDLDGFRAGAERLSASLETSRGAVERGGAAYLQYTRGLEGVDRSLAQAEGRVRTFGVTSAVTAGISDQLQNVLFAFGPAGEAIAVSMGAASTGMTGAATSAKLLNVALAAGLVGAIVAVAVGAGALVKNMFAIDTGLTDVSKTTGFTRNELTQLAGELQQVALATGTPVQKLLDLAAVAGSLGITGVQNVAQFTDTINKLAVATDIVGAEGAEQLAKFINVTKEAGQSVGDSAELVGNVIVRLGNELAATEAPILAMAGRIGGLATTAKLSQTDILALAGTYVSLGFTAEGAGTSLQSLVNKVYQAGQVGGPALTSFAKGAGMTEEAFRKLAQTDAAAAFEAYIGGLNEAQKAGVNIVPIIQEITNKNETMLGVITRGVGGFETLALSMDVARKEAEEMTAMNNELQTRLESLQGITTLIGQAFAYLGDTLAIAMIPRLKDALTGVLDFTRGMLGLEQTGDRAVTFATKSGIAIGQFTSAMVTGKTETETFAASVGLRFSEVAGFLDRIQQNFQDAGARSGAAAAEFLGLADASGDLSISLGTIQQNAFTAEDGLNQLNTATGKAGLTAAVETLASTLTGPGKEAFVTLARQAIASGQDITKIAGVIDEGYKAARKAVLETDLAVANSAVEAALKRQTQAYKDAGSEQLLSINNRIAAEKQLIAELEAREREFGENHQEEIKRIQATIVGLEEQKASAQATYDTWTPRIREANEEVNRTTDASNALTREIKALGQEEGPTRVAENMEATEVAAGEAGTAVERFGKLLEQQAGISRMSEEQARAYKDKLVELRNTYPEMTDRINPLIAATNTQIASFKDAGGAATDLGTDLEETGRTAGEMADNIVAAAQRGDISMRTALDSLTLKLRSLKAEKANALASGDYDPEDMRQLDSDISDVTDALNLLEPKTANVFKPVEEGARATFQPINFVGIALGQMGRDADAAFTTFREGAEGAVAAAEGFGPSANEAANATRAWGEAAYTSADAQRDMYASVVEANAQLKAQDAVLAQLGLAIATEDTNRLASAQQLAADNASRSRDAWQELKETQDGYATTTRFTADQLNLLAGVQSDVRTALQEAENAFTITGDAEQYAADKAEIYRQALDTLARAGIDPATVQLEGWVATVERAEQVADALALAQEVSGNSFLKSTDVIKTSGEVLTDYEAIMRGLFLANKDAEQSFGGVGNEAELLGAQIENTERAIVAATEKYGENSRTVEELQNNLVGYRTELSEVEKAEEFAKAAAEGLEKVIDELGTSAGKTPADFAAMEAAIFAAAKAGIIAGDEMVRLLAQINELEQRARDAKALEGLGTILGQLGTAVGEGSKSIEQTGMAAAILGIGAAATEAGGLMDEFAGDLGSQLGAAGQVFGVFADVVRQAFGEDIPSEVEIGLSAIETGIQGAAAGFAIGGPIGAAIGGGLGLIFGFFTASSQAAEQAAAEEKARQEEAAKAHAEFIEKWKERERERIESIREGQRELDGIYREMAQSSRDMSQTLNEARLDNARASGASESAIFISETILAIRQASAEFHQEMARITREKEEFIASYLQANPNASRGEAEARAEQLFGPEREAYREQYVLTTETLLLEGEKQAKELGLSQKEYYEAVFAGNTELLGNMTEGQRQAILEFVRIAQEMGIELPKYITDAADAANQAQAEAGESNAQAQRDATQNRIKAMEEEKAAFTNAWAERGRFLQQKIDESTGATKAMYEEMFRVEQLAYLEGINERNGAINEANASIAENDVGAIKDRLKVVDEALKTATGSQREALLAERRELVAAIDEGKDGVGSAIEADAQAQVDSLNAGLATLNSAWATRSAELKNLIDNSSGAAKAEYQRMYDEESLAYNNAVDGFMTDLQSANQRLLDAQDKGVDDFVAAQEEVGRKEQEALNGVFAMLREILGPDADVIISLIQTTYDKRTAAYGAGGENASRAAELAAESERQSIANVNQVLRDLFGPEAQSIIDQILALGEKKRKAHQDAGAAAGEGARLAAESERQSIANINQLLRDIFGPEAEGIIAQILALGNKKAQAHKAGGESAGAGAKAGGEAEGKGAAEGGDAAAQGVAESDQKTTGAIETRRANIASLLARDDLTPALRTSLSALDAAFREGGNLTAAEIAANRDKVNAAINERGAKIQALVQQGVPLAEAVRQVDTELARTFDLMGAEIARGAQQGGVTAAGGITAGQDSQLAAIERLKSSLVTGAAGIGGQVTPAIAAEHQKLMDAFIQGAQRSEGGISEAERKQITAMEVYQRQLEARAGVITTGVTPAVGRAHEAISGAFGLGAGTVNTSIAGAFGLISGTLTNQGPQFASQIQSVYGGIGTTLTTQGGEVANRFGVSSDAINRAVGTGFGTISSTVGSASGTLASAIGRGYNVTLTAQNQGSNAQVEAIRRAAQAEEAQFRSQSAQLLQAISTAKGAEKERLIDQYQALQQSHEQKSRDYAQAIKNAGTDEKSKLGDAARLVAGGLKDMGDDEKAAAERAYELTRRAHEMESNLYRILMGNAADDERQKAILAAVTTSGGLTRMGGDNVTATTNAFKRMKDEFVLKSGQYQNAVRDEGDFIKGALDKVADLISGFKFPSFPPLPKPPTLSRADDGGSLDSTSMQFASPFAPTVGAFAADGLPDYSSATGQVRAYAAATGTLLDLFDNNRTLSLTSTQERALTLNVSFTGFGAALATPISLLERVANTMWESARFERETAALNRETAELWRTNVQRQATHPGVRLQSRRRR